MESAIEREVELGHKVTSSTQQLLSEQSID